jgi:hypothetical protein
MTKRVVLYGAAGHTGGFVAAEMARRGWGSVLAGRSYDKLAPVAARHGAEAKEANVASPAQLDALLAGADALINTAGPFGDTSPRLIEAALRAGIPYFDVTGEPFVARDIFHSYSKAAEDKGIVIAPAFAFFGALGDLLVTAAKRDWDHADTIDLAFALDQWRPTNGSRLAGARRAGRRLVLAGGQLVERAASDAVPKGRWQFAAPFGDQPTVGEFSTVDVVTIARHVAVDSIATWINEAPLADLGSADLSGPQPADASGRSAQQFTIDAAVRRGSETRRASASGRDIYAISAPIVCEAVSWVLAGRHKIAGVRAAGELFDAEAFLAALSPDPLSLRR